MSNSHLAPEQPKSSPFRTAWRRHALATYAWVLVIVFFSALAHYGDQQAIEMVGYMKDELKALRPPSDATLLNEEDHHKAGSAYIERYYRSDFDFASVKGTYEKQLLAQGWRNSSAEDKRADASEFCRNGYRVVISKCEANTFRLSIGWHIGVCGR